MSAIPDPTSPALPSPGLRPLPDLEALMRTPEYQAMMNEAERQMAALVAALRAAALQFALPPTPQPGDTPPPVVLPPKIVPPDPAVGIDLETVLPPGPAMLLPELSGLPYLPGDLWQATIDPIGIGLPPVFMADELLLLAPVAEMRAAEHGLPAAPVAGTPTDLALPFAHHAPPPPWERHGDGGEGGMY